MARRFGHRSLARQGGDGDLPHAHGSHRGCVQGPVPPGILTHDLVERLLFVHRFQEFGDGPVTDHAFIPHGPFARRVRVTAQFHISLKLKTDLLVSLEVLDLLLRADQNETDRRIKMRIIGRGYRQVDRVR